MMLGDPTEALVGFESVVAVLPRITPRRLARADHEYGLGQLVGFAAQAASAAVAAGQPGRAIELLEQTRGVLLAEALDARGELQHDWDTTVAAIRSRPGFADFLRPMPIEDLSRAAADGPVVLAYDHATAFLIARDAALRAPTLTERHDGQHLVSAVLGRLWDAVAEPVLTVLGISGPPPPGRAWPRLWWCPVGMLALLLLHAAGYHHDDGHRSVLDRVVSSDVRQSRLPARRPGRDE